MEAAGIPVTVTRPAQEKPLDGRCLLCHPTYIGFVQEGEAKPGKVPRKGSFPHSPCHPCCFGNPSSKGDGWASAWE